MKTLNSLIGGILLAVGFFLGSWLIKMADMIAPMLYAFDIEVPSNLNMVLFLIGMGTTIIPAIIFLSISKILGRLQEAEEANQANAAVLNEIKGKLFTLEDMGQTASAQAEVYPAPPVPPSNTWICKICSVRNKDSSAFCKGCGEHK